MFLAFSCDIFLQGSLEDSGALVSWKLENVEFGEVCQTKFPMTIVTTMTIPPVTMLTDYCASNDGGKTAMIIMITLTWLAMDVATDDHFGNFSILQLGSPMSQLAVCWAFQCKVITFFTEKRSLLRADILGSICTILAGEKRDSHGHRAEPWLQRTTIDGWIIEAVNMFDHLIFASMSK